jgi:hypothetical protein
MSLRAALIIAELKQRALRLNYGRLLNSFLGDMIPMSGVNISNMF